MGIRGQTVKWPLAASVRVGPEEPLLVCRVPGRRAEEGRRRGRCQERQRQQGQERKGNLSLHLRAPEALGADPGRSLPLP